MDLEKVFKNLIIADFVSMIFIFISGMNMPKDLMEMSEYLPAGIYETELGAVVTLLILIAYAISLILLYRYFTYGKKIYVAITVIGIILDLAGGAYIMTSISLNLAIISSMISGAILTLLFFSPIKNKFS